MAWPLPLPLPPASKMNAPPALNTQSAQDSYNIKAEGTETQGTFAAFVEYKVRRIHNTVFGLHALLHSSLHTTNTKIHTTLQLLYCPEMERLAQTKTPCNKVQKACTSSVDVFGTGKGKGHTLQQIDSTYETNAQKYQHHT